MLRFTTKGTPFDRGEQQGRACRDLALPWLRSRLERSGKLPGSFVSRWVESIERVYPDGIEESRGIAQGLGLKDAEYFGVVCEFLNGGGPQCTTCGLSDERGHPLLAKTDDLFPEELGRNVLETTVPDRGYRHIHFHFVASIWTVAGMNEHGLAIAMTGIPGPKLDQDGMPSLVALHTILPACATVQETLDHLKGLRINRYGFSLLIGDGKGDMALVEKTGIGMTVSRSKNGESLLHTNHILDRDFAKQNPPQSEPVATNGRRRYDNVTALAKHLPGTEKGLRDLVSDRNPVGAICQRGEDRMHTDFAVIFSPVEKRMTFWPGNPVATQAETVDVVAAVHGGSAMGPR